MGRLTAALAVLAAAVAAAAGGGVPSAIRVSSVVRGWIREASAAERQHPAPVTIAFASAEHGVLALRNGVVITSDGGRTWQPGAGLHIRRLWVVGRTYVGFTAARTLVESVDGARWSRVPGFQPPPRGARVTALADTRHLWAGSYASSDGGRSWVSLRIPCTSGFSALAFVTVTRGFDACGGEGAGGQQRKALYETRDGGAHWQLVGSRPPPEGYIGDLRAFAGRIYLVADRLGYSVSTDGGRSWQIGLISDDTDSIVDLAWADRREGFVILANAGVVRTADGGRTWHQVYPPVDFRPKFGYSFSSPLDGLGIGYDDGLTHAAAEVVRTTDGGKTWRPWSHVPVGTLMQLARTGAQDVWALGVNSVYPLPHGGQRTFVLRSSDDGRRWARISSFAGAFTLSVVDARHAFLTGKRSGRTLATSDGGVSWHPLASRVPARSSVHYVSPTEGWALVGEPSTTILHTTDAGRTWNTEFVNLAGVELFAVAFSDARHGWLVGHDCVHTVRDRSGNRICTGAVLRTVDGGRRWQLVRLPRVFGFGAGSPDFTYEGPQMATATTGYVQDAGLFRTDDGGRSWRYVAGANGR